MNAAMDYLQKNYDNAAPTNYTAQILIDDFANNKASEIIEKRFDDLIAFISDNGNANIYDKHFKAMLSDSKNKAVDDAYKFLFEQAKLMIKDKNWENSK